jgi:GntR family transcriptional regulator / MocR family aminotransferase
MTRARGTGIDEASSPAAGGEPLGAGGEPRREAAGDGRRAVEPPAWFRVAPGAGETLRAALERSLREAIREGALREGARLPSSRRLAAQVGVSRGVVSDAYAQLEAQGYLVVRTRSAPVVAAIAPREARPADERRRPATQPRFDMTPTTPDVTLFPRRQWLAALSHAVRHAPAHALDYGDPRGELALRETLADHLGRTRGVIADPARIVVVQGTAQGLDVILRAAGARRIAVEDPSLTRQHERVRALGLELTGARVDEHGVVVGELDGDATLVTPAHQFPTGVVLSGERRRELLAWARAGDALILEDDYDAEFRYDREPVRALQGLDPERVAYLGTVSKTLAPALRLGWVVVPPDLADAAAAAKRRLDSFTPALDQLALERLLSTGEYDRHVRRVRALYRARRDAVSGALAEHLPHHQVGGVAAGLHVLLRLPEGDDDAAAAAAADSAGIRVEAVSEYAMTPTKPALVIGFGRIHETAVEPAIRALARVLAP